MRKDSLISALLGNPTEFKSTGNRGSVRRTV